ncbi:MAG: hypothetical protein HKN40_08955 [Winogradskyella sp.]|jgi:hypothetical protein|uniref:hypothetical protein n=1 Tax=Winogradskyella sp. TaxID=1883156 RepID=UPI00184812E4|nr:hypothetical protein [Winogradskyella sp.]
MFKYINKQIMAFKDIFKDDNDVNEKNVIGFLSFAVMVLFAAADLITGYFGKDLVVQEFIYNSFVFVTLGCFGIAGLEKFAKKGE